jgi:hypothetical protein
MDKKTNYQVDAFANVPYKRNSDDVMILDKNTGRFVAKN